jgi:hypothetical protein
MKRRLLLMMTAGSAAAFVAVVLLCGLGYYEQDSFTVCHRVRDQSPWREFQLRLYNVDGRLTLQTHDYSATRESSLPGPTGSAVAPWRCEWLRIVGKRYTWPPSFLGFYAAKANDTNSDRSRFDIVHGWVVPDWFLAAVAVALPAVRVRAIIRHRRMAMRSTAGLCQHCGYDLRGTPERCPECGTAVKAAGAAGGERAAMNAS